MELSAEDRLAITELTARYNHAIDHREARAWAALFTPDGVVRAGEQILAAGHADLVAFVERGKAQGRMARHWVNNIVIEGSSEFARMRLYVCAYDIGDPSAPLVPYMMAEYDDEVVKVDGKWLFKVRNLTAVAGRSKVFGGPAKARG
jgi:hypothetical protein